MSDEFVYIARCPAHKHRDTNKPLVKIGRTTKLIDVRMKDLTSGSSTPEPFECLYLFKCSNCKWLENELHEIFKDLRYWDRREYFAVTPECVKKVLERYEGSFCNLKMIENPETKSQVKPRKRQMQISDSKKSKIITLFRKGYSQVKISQELNVSINHVAKTIKSHKEEKGIATS